MRKRSAKPGKPTMRFVAVKSEETQGAASVFRVRELPIRQRTQVINALRGHLAEVGEVVPQGATNARRLIARVDVPDTSLPETARATLRVLIAIPGQLEDQIAAMDGEIARRAREDETADRHWRHRPGYSGVVETSPPSSTRGLSLWVRSHQG